MKHMQMISGAAACSLMMICAQITVAESGNGDWPQFLGPNRNGVVEGAKLASAWPTNGPQVLWRVDCAVGFAGPMVKDGVLVLMERAPKPKTQPAAATDNAATNAVPELPDEVVRAMDPITGQEFWRVKYPSGAKGDKWYWGPCATPAGAKDRVVCQFLDGNLRCLELKTGKLLWVKDMAAEYGMGKKGNEPMYQVCSSPLIARDLVVIEVCSDVGLVALSTADGKEVWRTPVFQNYGGSTGFLKMGDTNVVIAVPSSIDRKVFKGDVLGFHAQTGELLWSGNAEKSYYNAVTPVANEGLVVVEGGSGDGPTCAFQLQDLVQGTRTPLWKDPKHMARFSNYLIYRGLVFGQGFRAHSGPGGGAMFCNDPKDGTVLWEKATKETHQSMIGSDGKVLQLHEDGELAMFDADARGGYKELARARVVAQKGSVWSFPALVRGRLYVRSDREIVCLDLMAK